MLKIIAQITKNKIIDNNANGSGSNPNVNPVIPKTYPMLLPDSLVTIPEPQNSGILYMLEHDHRAI